MMTVTAAAVHSPGRPRDKEPQMNRQPDLRLKLFLVACVGLVLCLAGCGPGAAAPAATPTPAPAATATISPEIAAERLEILDIVWNTVNERFFDPEFNGVDWPAVYDEYRPQILAAADDRSFYVLLNQMCFELGVSHIAVLPPGSTDIEPLLSAPATAGLHLRLIGGQAVITEVVEGSPAACMLRVSGPQRPGLREANPAPASAGGGWPHPGTARSPQSGPSS
jgi:hypothetical protein